jgi:acyl-homoserine-lactone acylase
MTIQLKIIIAFLLLPVTIYCQIAPEDVTIARDSFGVPHIFGKTDAATSYGLAWAHAEDNFNDIQMVLLAGKGMLGRVNGKKGAQVDYVVSLLRCRDIAREKLHTLSPQFIKVIEAYLQGLNDYARTHPGEVKVKTAFPATLEDYFTTISLSLSSLSGVDKVLTEVFGGRTPLIPGFGESGGSNAFAFHPSRTTTGEAFLAINSHQPLEGPVAWYEAHLQSDEGLNILGGLFPGGPCVFAGVNEHLGWAHTVNNMDKVDVYQLKMNPSNKNQYEFDGQWLDLEVRKVALKVKGVPVKIKKKAYWSRYGATVKTERGVFSIRLFANQDITAMEQWWKMNKAKSFTEFYEILSMQGLPMFNIVYADRYDTIFYISGGRMPVRDNRNGFKWNSTVPGNQSATLWNSFYPIKKLPQYVNPQSGYLFNTNHSPFLASDSADNLNASDYDVNSGYETFNNNRSERFRELVQQQGKVDYEIFKRIKYDSQLPVNLKYIYSLDSMFTLSSKDYPDLQDVIDPLQKWNKVADTNSTGATVMALAFQFAIKKLSSWTNHTLTVAQCLEMFQFARDHQVKYFGRTGLKLGEIQKHIRGNKELPIWGMPDVLTAMYTTIQTDGKLKVTAGESYIQLVRFPKGGLPVIESINTYGASTHADSPHFTDQMELYASKKTRRVTLDKNEVLQNAVSTYHPMKDQKKNVK